MKSNEIVMERVVSILAFTYVSVVLFGNFYLLNSGYISKSLIPHSDYIIIGVHCIVSIGTFINIFKPNLKNQFIYFQLESIVSILSCYEILGVFLFYCSLAFLYIQFYPSKKLHFITIICFVLHIISLSFTIVRGLENFIIYIFSTIFIFSIFLYFFEVLRSKYSCFAPKLLTINSNISNLKPGTEIQLSSLGLTERQVNFVYDFIYDNLNYSELSSKYIVSLSTVKHEFTEIYKILGVSKLDELRLLLIQYKISK